MTDPALLLIIADALVARLRARLECRCWDDPAQQRDTLARLIEAEERAARLGGVPEWGDLPELRERLAEVTRWAAEGGGAGRRCGGRVE